MAADDARINDAIKNGIRYLETSNLRAGEHGIGPACLVGLALLEGGVNPASSAVQTVHSIVRAAAPSEVHTYQVSLAILFLDRLGHASDVGLIQILGARLLAGQTLTAGWGYTTFDVPTPADEARVRAVVSAPPARGILNSEASRIVSALAQGARPAAALGGDDNSNTQFALIALWVARRSGLPTDLAFSRIRTRFLRTQSVSDGGWGYTAGEATSSPSMTCAGLLGLAAAKASAESELSGSRPSPDGKPTKPDEEDPFLRPPAPGDNRNGDAGGVPRPSVDAATTVMTEKAIERGLTSLGKLLQTNAGLRVSEVGHYGGLDDLYFLWSLERVAVAFGLDTIGGVNWYKWGCDAILPAQQQDGSWPGKYGSPAVSTSFALLFLKKANFTSDLSRKISGKIKDPGGGELRGNRGNLPGRINPAGTVARRRVDDPKAASINPVRATTEADRIAEQLFAASDRDWPARLATAKTSKGPQFTAALAQAIAILEGKRLYQAREALAERLTRMTVETLKQKLTDRDAEIRRATCLAVAMKDERTLVPEVIDCITDPNDIVLYAAKAALKAMSEEDHGPPVGATEDEKRNAASEWRLWYAKSLRK